MAEQMAPMGWYDDPTQPGTQRFWDGTAWTEDRRPSTQATGATPRRSVSGQSLTSTDVRDQRFDSSFRGYAEDEVNAFLERAANSLRHFESGRPGGCTSTDVDQVTFHSTFGGLSEAQVDEFLDRVAAALRTYEQEPDQQMKRRASTTRQAKAARVDVATVASSEPVTAAEVSVRSFPEERSGYTESNVDDLLRRAAESLEAWESGEAGELTSDDAAHTRFFIDIRGYPKREVDEFVGRIVSTLRRYEQTGV